MNNMGLDVSENFKKAECRTISGWTNCEKVPSKKQSQTDVDVSYAPSEVRMFMDLADNGGIKNTMKNCLTVFRLDANLQQSIRYNEFTTRIDVLKTFGWDKVSVTLSNTDIYYILYYLEDTYGLTNERKIHKAISIIADQNRYHPVQERLNALVWDGQERIRHVLHHFFGAEINEYTYQAMKLFLLGAIERVFHPGTKFDLMLCLSGGQGAGKSTFFRFLALEDDWFTDDIRRIDDENIYRRIQGHWIIEMSEMLATQNAKGIEEIKAFLSRTREVYKVPYEIHPADRPRQCVFGGTSNNMDFLPLDRSGNRRFLPVIIHPEKAEVHILESEKLSRKYIEQLWAEAMVIFRKGGYSLNLSPEMEKNLKNVQKMFTPEDTKAGMVQAYLEEYSGNMVCSKQIYREALNHPTEEPRQCEIREINDIMNNSITGWSQFTNPRRFAGYGRQKGWERDNKISPRVLI